MIGTDRTERTEAMAKPKTLPYEAPETEGPYSVALHSQAGGSDKVYQLAIEPQGGAFVVNYANGRRGGTLATGAKTKAPVPYAQARKICNDVLFDKVGSGYVPTAGSRFGDGMKAEAIAAIAREASGQVPQLLAPIAEDDIEFYLTSDDWVAEPKHDGERRFVVVKDAVATGGNRKGQTVALPKAVADEAVAIGRDLSIDGELIGDRFHFWDLTSLDGIDLKDKPWHDRRVRLDMLEIPAGAMRATVPATTEASKRKMLADIRAAGGEGIVFKLRSAKYDSGKPGSDATWVKFKLWNGLSAVVSAVNAKRSVALELVGEDGSRIGVGNVTIPANKDVPKVGDVVEVSYLYAYDGGSLFQPNFIGVRSDIDASECLASQRVFKAEEPDEEVSAGMRM
jgi:bifunctional non-homologous end joining protein LigD